MAPLIRNRVAAQMQNNLWDTVTDLQSVSINMAMVHEFWLRPHYLQFIIHSQPQPYFTWEKILTGVTLSPLGTAATTGLYTSPR
jgi:hypothetical protein